MFGRQCLIRKISAVQKLVLSVFWAFVCCSPKAPVLSLDAAATGNTKVEIILHQAILKFEEGKYGEADEGFATIIREYSEDPTARTATVFRARIALAMDNPERARDLLSDLKGTSDPIAERALIYDAVAMQQMGDNKEVINVLTRYINRLTEREDIIALETALWNALREEKDLAGAAASAERLLAYIDNNDEKRDIIYTYKKLLVPITDIDTLDKIVEGLKQPGGIKSETLRRIAELYLEAGRFQEAADILDNLEAVSRREQEEQREQVVEEDKTDPAAIEDVDMNTVGLLFPISGRSRLVGDAALKGAELGAMESGIKVVVRDCMSSAEDAVSAVEQLVKQDRVSAIIGPLEIAAADAAAKRAQELKVPIIVMSVKEETPLLGDYVFREFSGNRAEPATLVGVTKFRGARRAGVLFPETGYGRTMRAIFAGYIKESGMDLVSEISYPENTVSFKDQAERIAKSAIDILFIPDQASRIALAAPALAAAGLWSTSLGQPASGPGKPVQLIIPSVGYSDDLIRRAGRYLDGALFTVFFAPDVHPFSQAFAARYHAEYGSKPSTVSAYARDAALIVGQAIKEGVSGRSGLQQWLLKNAASAAASLSTATPFAGFTQSGTPRATPYVIEISESAPKVVDITGIPIHSGQF